MGFKAKRNIRKCQKCKNVIRERFNIETSLWECPICGTPTPTRRKRNIKDEEDLKEYNRKKAREHRKRWPIGLRRGDRKDGSGCLGSKNKEGKILTEKEIDQEYKRLKLRQNYPKIKLKGD
jgi:DNA-directed RNA polymerase subunit M/transcription elongation factor TFIIS